MFIEYVTEQFTGRIRNVVTQQAKLNNIKAALNGKNAKQIK